MPTSQAADTEAAIADMTMARSYLDDWYDKPGDRRDILSFAARYVESARTKDPEAKLIVPSKTNNEPREFTQNDLASEILFCEAHIYYRPTADKKTLLQAVDRLKRALVYSPMSIVYRSKLCDVYLDLHDKVSAMATANEAVKLLPNSIDARKLCDRIEAAPYTSAPSFIERNPGCLTALGAILLVGGVGTLVAHFVGAVSEGVPVACFIAGGILYFLGRSMESKQAFDQIRADQDRKS